MDSENYYYSWIHFNSWFWLVNLLKSKFEQERIAQTMELIVPFKQLSKQLKQPLPFKLLIFLRELFFFQVQNSIHFLLPGNFNLNLLFQEDYYDSLRLKVLLVLEFLETFSLAQRRLDQRDSSLRVIRALAWAVDVTTLTIIIVVTKITVNTDKRSCQIDDVTYFIAVDLWICRRRRNSFSNYFFSAYFLTSVMKPRW